MKPSIFHAIECNFYEALKFLLPENYVDREWMIISKDDYFQKALTPILLAAINNNYRILRRLYEESVVSQTDLQVVVNLHQLKKSLANHLQDREYDDEPYITFSEYTVIKLLYNTNPF